MSEHEGVNFWKAVSIALITFILGNGISYAVFGMRTASRDDLEKFQRGADERATRLELRMESVEKAVNYLSGKIDHEKP